MIIVTVPLGCHGISSSPGRSGYCATEGCGGRAQVYTTGADGSCAAAPPFPWVDCFLPPVFLHKTPHPPDSFDFWVESHSFCFCLHPITFGETFGVVVGKGSWVVGPIDDHPLLPGNGSHLPVLESTSSGTLLSKAGVGSPNPLITR